MKFRIDDFPPAVQSRIRAAMRDSQPAEMPTKPASIPKAGRTGKGPNKGEAEYAVRFLAGKDARFEGATFRLANGHRYTPDWVVVEDGRPAECHEVKGAHRLGSERSARLAFDQARVEWAGLRWVWARRGKDGWEVGG